MMTFFAVALARFIALISPGPDFLLLIKSTLWFNILKNGTDFLQLYFITVLSAFNVVIKRPFCNRALRAISSTKTD